MNIPENRRARDVDVLTQWGVNSHLTPAQLEFTFNSLVKTLSDELRAFNEQADEFVLLLLSKCQRVHIIEKKNETPTIATERPQRKDQNKIEDYNVEIKRLFRQIPLGFLQELFNECVRQDDGRTMEYLSLKSA